MNSRRWILGAGRAGELWPVLLLLVVVVVPTLGVLWFVSVATTNEHLAARQKLADAYRAHLTSAQGRIDDFWATTATSVQDARDDVSPAACFAEAARSGLAEAVVYYDADGALLYPHAPSPSPSSSPPDARWREAERLEYELLQPDEAAERYETIAAQADDDEIQEQARARQSQARCLLKAGRTEQMVQLIVDCFADDRLAEAADAQRRRIGPSVELMALERMQSSGLALDGRFALLRERLTARLDDYGDETFPSTQRLFLMKQLRRIPAWEPGTLPTLRAEQLAAEFVAAHPQPARQTVWLRSQLPDVWQYASPDGRALLLVETERLASLSTEAAIGDASPREVQLRLIAPQEGEAPEALMSVAAGPSLPGWRLSLTLLDDDQFDNAVMRRNTLYGWIGGLVVLSTALLALFLARAFRRQLHLARLKNDLVGTVSHELKTPLASMRVLVDTLLDAEQFDQQQVREYLQLIAKENTRLSRLIDSFLTFSRMEQGRQLFASKPLSMEDVVRRAVESAGERFRQDDCRLTIEMQHELPVLVGDSDALVTAILNLLDNAYKFSDAPREISVAAWSNQGRVSVAVTDNGMGMTRAAARRVFGQFHQVDQRLNRRGQGCGLGLSIVRYIVHAHGGEIHVDSQPGQGAVFTIQLPARTTKAHAVEEAMA